MYNGGLYTPQPKSVGILRSPHTPGTGSSVRFGMRTYEDGEESLLTASVSSRAEDEDVRSHDMSISGDSMEMSFTESFLRREVDGALAGLDQSSSSSWKQPTTRPLTPIRSSSGAEAPETIKPLKSMIQDADDTSPWSSPSSPREGTSTSPLSSPTVRPSLRRAPTPDDNVEHRRRSLEDDTKPESGKNGIETLAHNSDQDPAQEPEKASAPSPERTGTVSESQADSAEGTEMATEEQQADPRNDNDVVMAQAPREATVDQVPHDTLVQPEEPLDAAAPSSDPDPALVTHHEPLETVGSASTSSDALAPASTHESESSLTAQHTPTRPDASFASSSYSWATPRTESSARSASSPHTSAHWPGMYEFSYLTDKEELDDLDTGPLVPFAAQELSTKLFAIDSLADVDARELLDMVAALDRTHTERTIFLQHRLARSYRQCQILREQLRDANDYIHVFEGHVREFVRCKASWDEDDETKRATLQALTEQLESRLALLHTSTTTRWPEAITAPEPELTSKSTSAPAPTTSMDQQRQSTELDMERAELQKERAALEEERVNLQLQQAQLHDDWRKLDVGRRDLEVRRAEPSINVHEQVQQAIESTRQACMRDAEVRILVVRQEAADAMRELQARLTDAETQPSEAELLHAELENAKERTASMERHAGELKAQLHAQAKQIRAQEAWEAERLALEDVRAKAEMREKAARAELRQCEKARDETEAALKADISAWQQRVRTLERDVAHRELDNVQLQKQRDSMKQELQTFTLALAAKDQELSMLKRGTQGSAYWDLITQRTRSERRPLQNTTNRVRSTQETVDKAQKMLHSTATFTDKWPRVPTISPRADEEPSRKPTRASRRQLPSQSRPRHEIAE